MMSETVFVRNSARNLTAYQRRTVKAVFDIHNAVGVLIQAQAALHDAEVLAAAIMCRIDR
jgi:hypothetical protein